MPADPMIPQAGKTAQGVRIDDADPERVRLLGAWTLSALGGAGYAIATQIRRLAADGGRAWDLDGLDAMDSAAALLLWRAWGNRLPATLAARPEHLRLFERLAAIPSPPPPKRHRPLQALDKLGAFLVEMGRDLWGLLLLWGEILLELGRILRRPGDFPWKETSATVFKTGPGSLPILGLVGFLIGVVIAFQSAPTLADYGANIFVINIVGISILRELGPLIAAVILAGRSGSAFTAQIGAMRVTEELDALRTFGVSPVLRLVLPKVIGLGIAMPLLVLWTDFVAMIGGILISNLELGIGPYLFYTEMPRVVPIFNLWLGVVKGALFGVLVGWVSSFYGLKVQPNTESLSRETTNSVVLAITLVIIVDALLAMVFSQTGLSQQ